MNTKEIMKLLREICRIYNEYHDLNVIKPFLRYAPRLKEIKVDYIYDGFPIETSIVDLAALNKERIKLTGATKITIYVPENNFLVTKFAITKTELSFVRIKRAEEVEWTHEFHCKFD